MTQPEILFGSEDNDMKQHIATMVILTMITAFAFADFESDVYFLTNGVLGGGREHVDRCIRGLRKRTVLSDDDLAERLLFVADAFLAVQSKAVREFLQRAKEEDERERSREKTNRPKARWIQ